MVKSIPLVPVLLILLGPAVVGADDPTKKDADRIQGRWVVLAHMNNIGKPTDVEDVKKLKVTIEGRLLKLGDAKGEMRVLLKLDPGKSPKAVDLEIVGGKGTLPGIYELKGDMLKIAWNNDSKGERPKAFLTAPREGAGMLVLKRAKDR